MLEESVFISDSLLGKGVFSTRSFSLGENILSFRGSLLSFEQAVQLGDDGCYPLQIGEKWYVDIEPPGRFVNHSCEPNTGIRGERDLVALREIISGEELFYDYSTTMDEDYWTMACKCGSTVCRGVVKDFKYLPLDLQKRYLSLGIVQPYILSRALLTLFKRVF